MALTFPREMPDGWATNYFEPERNDFLNPTNGGKLYGISNGEPLWRGEWDVAPMAELDSIAMQAFLTSLRGPQRTFKGRDLRLARPYVYQSVALNSLTRADGAGFNSDGTVSWSANAEGDVLTLGTGATGTELPAAFQFTVGDYVGFRWNAGASRHAARCLETATASGAGEVSFSIEPAMPSAVDSGAVAYLNAPYVIMRRHPESVHGGMGPDRFIGGRLIGLQDLS